PPDSALVAQVLPEERARLAEVVAGYSEEDLLRIFDVLTKVEGELRWAQDPRVVLEMALLKLVQLRRLQPFAELVDRVERLTAGSPPVSRPALLPVAPPVRVAASVSPVRPAVSPTAVAPSPAETRRQDLLQRAAREPVVQEAL